MKKHHLLFGFVALVYVVTWIGISCVTEPALDSYGDMVENYAWAQTWALGSFKHPPFFAWMVKVWFDIFPTKVWAYYVLSYTNALVGILGIVALAKLWLPDALSAKQRGVFAFLVLLFALLSAPYSNLAAKFNADTVLLSSWPWTAYAFFAALHEQRIVRKWFFTILLGIFAAAAMLGKYFSVVLLLSLLVISASQPDYRAWWRSKYPYVALGVFFVLMLPHLIWEIWYSFPFQQYVDDKFTNELSISRIISFLLSGIYYLPLSWTAWWLLRRKQTSGAHQIIAWAIPLRSLVLLCVLPALITVTFHLLTRIHLTAHWAIPVWFALPALMAVLLLPLLDNNFAWKPLMRALGIFWAVLVGGTAIYTLISSVAANTSYTHAAPQLAQVIEQHFAERFPGQKLSWVSNSWSKPGAVAFFGKNHPRALPAVPDSQVSQVNPFPEWNKTYGAILCTPNRSGGCERAARKWLQMHGLSVDGEVLHYRAEGWQFLRAKSHDITVFWVPPTAW